MCSAALLYLTVCNPMDCSPPSSSVHGIFFSSKNTGAGCHFFLQGIFLTQGSNPHLLHWQADSLPQSHLGSPLCVYIKGNSLAVQRLGHHTLTAGIQGSVPGQGTSYQEKVMIPAPVRWNMVEWLRAWILEPHCLRSNLVLPTNIRTTWANYSTSLCLSFSIFKRKAI